MFENVQSVHQGELLTALRPSKSIADDSADDNLSRFVRRIPFPGTRHPPRLPFLSLSLARARSLSLSLALSLSLSLSLVSL